VSPDDDARPSGGPEPIPGALSAMGAADRSGRRRAVRGRRRWGRRIGWVVAALVLLVVALAGWLGVRGWLAKDHLESAAALLPTLEQQALSGKTNQAELRRLQHEADAARELTSDRVWSGASHLPWVGDDLSAVRAVARAADIVADRAAPQLLQAAGTLDPSKLRPKNGRIDLGPLTTAQAPLRAADQRLHQARAVLDPYVSGPRSASLLSPVRRAVNKLAGQLDDLTGKTTSASRAADLLPPMLGANGKRRYLVLFQNLAEARSLGGIAGAFAVIEADDGRLRLTKQGSAASFPRSAEPVVEFSPPQLRLYLPRTAQFFQNVTQPMSFPVGAGIAREMWDRSGGAPLDGVLATDPVALSYLLKATGSVTLTDGQRLTSENAVRLLMRDVYDTYDNPRAQDAFFASAAMSVFQHLMAGAVDPAVAMDALARAGEERRFLVWSSHADEQRRLLGTTLDGVLPSTEKANPTVGVFFNDATASKMSYYLRATAELSGGQCRADGLRDLSLVLTLTSKAPPRGLPPYVTGDEKPHTVSTLVYLASPVDGGVVTVAVDAKNRPINTQQVAGRAVSTFTVDLRPGQTAEVKVSLVAPNIPGTPRLRITPTVAPVPELVSVTECAVSPSA